MTGMEFSGNIFDLNGLKTGSGEVFEDLLNNGNLRVERIISSGQVTPEGTWYDQEQDEWVIVLKGQAVLELEGKDPLTLDPGDYLLLPAHCRHRVIFTTESPECIWLAIHGKLTV